MAGSKFFIFAFCCLFFLKANGDIFDHVGINWGRHTTQKLLPSMVIDMLLENGIKKVKLFSLTDAVLSAFAGTNIEVMVTIPTILLTNVNTTDDAKDWVRSNIDKYTKDVHITNVVIANEPFSALNDEPGYLKALSVMKNIQTALNDANYANIKATIPHFMDVLTMPNNNSKYIPSQADFREDAKETMLQVLKHLRDHDAPFLANISPMYFMERFNLTEVEFLFVDNQSNYTLQDKNVTYTNAFEAAYDAFYSALKLNGFSDLKLIVGQVGWPTDGAKYATLANAERFYKGFLKKMAANKGTPLQEGPLNVFLYNLQDENKIKTDRSPYQRHWGIYKFDGTPKYKIDFTGQGRDIYPKPAKGVMTLPLRWCVFNNDTNDISKVQRNYDLACNFADCSSLEVGGSCTDLDFNKKVSYAFNSYYQIKTQKSNDLVCRFDGLGKIVTDNPTVGGCEFPVEILMSLEDRGWTAKASGLATNTAVLMSLFALYMITAFL